MSRYLDIDQLGRCPQCRREGRWLYQLLDTDMLVISCGKCAIRREARNRPDVEVNPVVDDVEDAECCGTAEAHEEWFKKTFH